MTQYTTLADVRAWLTGIQPSQTTDDVLLTSLIARASAFIDSYIGRGIISADYTETLNGNDSDSMFVKNFPITAVSSVTVDLYTYSPSNTPLGFGYTFDSNRVYLRGGRFCRGSQNVVISYTGGYAQVPADIQQAAIELVVFKYKSRNHVGMASHSQDRVVVDHFIQSEVPPEVQCILDRYRRTMYLG